MNPKHLNKLLDVVRQKNLIDQDSEWSNGSETYFREIRLELDEVQEELDSDRNCYLEDELGDVFWDYLNLLLALEQEGKISLSRVFERSLAKYSERIEGIQQGVSWSEVKQKQKQRLAEEQAIEDHKAELI
ncbi:MazG nucleotide pyrophosphohydrolase domain-containing protein [Endozoicomonas elysicola]|uniref:Nucleotide pyrophosphohydrolase n=1 Tax=Endozoicomonas elysicola TaxID=305900 RepID=A0A081KAA4_9GAMM|nr:MazG nucleotide pyrophosphohydrolase domain-containing protein [Endozoicomonas elysicola]KEI71080.1 nucleotide pyrophosphohydrolase [Endozoicomonas elysicola]